MASILDISNINNWTYDHWLLFESAIQKSSTLALSLNEQASKSKIKDTEWDVATNRADIWWSNTVNKMINAIFNDFNIKNRNNIINNIANDTVNIWNNEWKSLYITKKEWIKIATWAIIKDNKRFYNVNRNKLGAYIINIFKAEL